MNFEAKAVEMLEEDRGLLREIQKLEAKLGSTLSYDEFVKWSGGKAKETREEFNQMMNNFFKDLYLIHDLTVNLNDPKTKNAFQLLITALLTAGPDTITKFRDLMVQISVVGMLSKLKNPS